MLTGVERTSELGVLADAHRDALSLGCETGPSEEREEGCHLLHVVCVFRGVVFNKISEIYLLFKMI